MKKFSLTSVPVKHNRITAAVLLALAVAAVAYLSTVFTAMWNRDTFYPGPGVTRQTMLSEWLPALEGTAGDTPVYILEGQEEGGKMLVLGGTHANEPSGVISAVYLLENCKVKQGTLIVIPQTNATGFTCTDAQEAAPMTYTITTANGSRTFRYGSRAGNVVYQWPDPDIYVRKAADGQTLSGSETRNLNRTYPGVANGTMTEKISCAVTNLIKTEGVNVTVDLHEASPEYQTINAVVAHEDAMNLAAEAKLWLEDEVPIAIETSAPNLHGLTHRELGDYTDTLALLMETSNAAQGRLHGATSSELVVTGKDKYYVRARNSGNGVYGRLYVDYTDAGYPLAKRVARHVTYVAEFANDYGAVTGEAPIVLENVASYGELNEHLYDYLVDAKNR